MKKKFWSARLKTILIVALVAAVVLGVAAAIASGTTFGENLVGTILSPFRAGIAAHFGDYHVAFLIREGVLLRLALYDLVKRRCRGVNMALLYKRAHMPEEEGEQKRFYVCAVDIGIRHDDYFAVAELGNIKFAAHAGADRHYKRDYLRAGINAVDTVLFDIEYLAAHRQYRLESAVSSFLRRSACGISLYKE